MSITIFRTVEPTPTYSLSLWIVCPRLVEPYPCIIGHERRFIKSIPPINLLLLPPHILHRLLLLNVQPRNQLIYPTECFLPLTIVVAIIHPRIIVIIHCHIHLLLGKTAMITLFYI